MNVRFGFWHLGYLPIEVGSSRIHVCVGIGRVPGVNKPRVSVSQRGGVVEPVSRRFPGGRHFRFTFRSSNETECKGRISEPSLHNSTRA
jgi:hypothetical protein